MLTAYFKRLYERTMREAYALAEREIIEALAGGGNCLDCGAADGYRYQWLSQAMDLPRDNYSGIEWDVQAVEKARHENINVQRGDLNHALPFEDETLSCVFALSVLEHLLYGCRFMKECHRTLKPGGTLVLLTPNISTYFTAMLILLGKMPSSGPHPDSEILLEQEELFIVRSSERRPDVESDMPVHRHLVVFSFLVLRDYLNMIGFSDVKGYGFGLYPFPPFMQKTLERLDPYHCHQMVFVAKR